MKGLRAKARFKRGFAPRGPVFLVGGKKWNRIPLGKEAVTYPVEGLSKEEGILKPNPLFLAINIWHASEVMEKSPMRSRRVSMGQYPTMFHIQFSSFRSTSWGVGM